MFNRFKKKNTVNEELNIAAMATGQMIDVTTVPDDVFAKKIMGETIAFTYEGNSVVIAAPAHGTITALFSTKHAFGITMKNGVELLVHIGINTVEAEGEGFQLLNKKQGDEVKIGDPIVEVDLEKLERKYDMSTMLIITNDNGHQINFKEPGYYQVEEKINY